MKNEFILDGNEVDKFCTTWLGSGDENPGIVFIGLEFSSEARNEKTISSFFNEIKDLKYPEIVADYTDFVTRHSRAIDPNFKFDRSPYGASNPTRHKMAVMAYCILNNLEPSQKIRNLTNFKNFARSFANKGSNTAAWELYPLPCTSETDFKYSSWLDISTHPQFCNKTAYREYYSQIRKKILQNRIKKSDIKNLIMYSMGNKSEFESILGIQFDEKKTESGYKFYYKKIEERNYILIKHFVSPGFSYKYVNEVLKHVKD